LKKEEGGRVLLSPYRRSKEGGRKLEFVNDPGRRGGEPDCGKIRHRLRPWLNKRGNRFVGKGEGEKKAGLWAEKKGGGRRGNPCCTTNQTVLNKTLRCILKAKRRGGGERSVGITHAKREDEAYRPRAGVTFPSTVKTHQR